MPLSGLELYQLKRYCRKHGLDHQEIDSALTYSENMKHLRSLARMLSSSLDTFELARMEALQEQYMSEHFLSYYTACHMRGETRSEEVGVTDTSPQRFSLRTVMRSDFPLGFC